MFDIDIQRANQYSPLTLAFLGDAVYEQLVREKIVLTANMPVKKLHKEAVERVRAAYQSKAVDVIMPYLTEEEEAVFKRGRNATGNTVPKSSNPVEYRRATALETLFGYLHLTGKSERIVELFDIIWYNVNLANEES
ncbi:MAG: ribonuclease III [Oscillospiraceae bacterium]|nr:ribonuclease III [Oscillospiraceae bacterium]